MGRTLVAGVDSSTQATKIVVCDAHTGELVREGRAAHPDGTSVDAWTWWRAFEKASEGGLLDDVAAIGVAAQQHGMVALNADDEPVHDALLWNDTRSAQAADDLIAELGSVEQWVTAVGSMPVAATTAAKVRWLAQAKPDVAAQVERIVLPHDWVTGQLLKHRGGFTEWTTDAGDASGTGYWDPATGAYQEELQRLAFGRDFKTPRVLRPCEPAGTTHAGLLVAAGTGDNMGAALGLGLEPGDVVVSLGTSGTVCTVTELPVADASGALVGFASADGRYLPLMCTLNAARVLTSAAEMLHVSLDELSDLALAAEPGADGLTLLPYLDGERTPNLPYATGALLGLTRTNMTPAHVARAAVEGMLANLVAGVDRLIEAGANVKRIVLIGGAAASPAVRTIAPLLFGRPVHIPPAGEYVGRGAARQAAWCLTQSAQPPHWVNGPTDVVTPTSEQLDQGRQVMARYREFAHRLFPGAL